MLSQWQHILRPIDCGPMRLKNRLTSAPINTGLENLSNLAALADFYAEAAADGVSLVTIFSPALSGQAKQNADILPQAWKNKAKPPAQKSDLLFLHRLLSD